MKEQQSQPVYGPDEWDFDFSFDLEFSLTDYLLVGLYLILVGPFVLLFRLIHYLYSLMGDAVRAVRSPSKRAQPTHGMLTMISKLF